MTKVRFKALALLVLIAIMMAWGFTDLYSLVWGLCTLPSTPWCDIVSIFLGAFSSVGIILLFDKAVSDL